MSKANEAELVVLRDERHDLITQIVRMTEEYVNTTRPLHLRVLDIEDELGPAGWL
jgi:hypothetical protein